MTSKEKSKFSKYLITFVVSIIPELFFSWIVGKIIDTSLWYVWLALQVIKLFLWLMRSVVGYLLFHLVWKNSTIDDIYASLVQHKYPNPTKYGSNSVADSFFFSVMNDDELEWQIRLEAAQTYGILSTSVNTQGFFGSMRMDKIFMKAIDKYHEINFSGKDYLDISNIYTADDYVNAIKSMKSKTGKKDNV